MDSQNYRKIIKTLGTRKSMGQNFMLSRDIAMMEAEYARDINAVELGPGLGILTSELCVTAKSVLAVEKDSRLFGILSSSLNSEKLRLVNSDFFSLAESEFKGIDIMVSNIPYSLSSKVIYWLGSRNMPALICIQKEFAEHMTASPGTRSYSKLSVMSHLRFRVHHVKDVSANNFYPVPKVDSALVYLAPKPGSIDMKTAKVISLIMTHKKKRLHNAIIDSSKGLGISKEAAKRISSELEESDGRPFQLEPEAILHISKKVASMIG